MAAFQLEWKEGEGYDIHVLRGSDATTPGLPSKALDASFKTQFQLAFEPHFKGAPRATALGLSVVTGTGVVTATAHPSTSQPKLRNFLMTARQDDQQGNIFETVIRIHVHDSIKKIWLTPSSLTIHEFADECRFTVLALFDDDTVGDITEWPQLAYTVPSSLPPQAIPVHVLNRGDMFRGPDGEEKEEIIGGRLRGQLLPEGAEGGNEAGVKVDLKLTSPPTDLSATARVFVTPGWSDMAKDPNTKVTWVKGQKAQRPKEEDIDSLKSTVKSRPNILFISEGFLKSAQAQKDFEQAVQTLVKTWSEVEYLQPFNLLADSILVAVRALAGGRHQSAWGSSSHEASQWFNRIQTAPSSSTATGRDGMVAGEHDPSTRPTGAERPPAEPPRRDRPLEPTV
jgi:hypothetical protein